MRHKILVCVESDEKSVPYVDALVATGVEAESILVVTPESNHGDLTREAAQAAGVVMCGGPDLEPWRFGEEPREDANLSLMPELDALEWDVLAGAEASHTPIWAICRGLQTINVYRGGTLWQDIPTQLGDGAEHSLESPLHALAHDVHVTRREERVGELLGGEPTPVNSRHHQAVKELGEDLVEVARSPDDVLEVLVYEREDHWWIKAVQWHPENLVHLPVQRELWREFVARARRHDAELDGEQGEPA